MTGPSLRLLGARRLMHLVRIIGLVAILAGGVSSAVAQDTSGEVSRDETLVMGVLGGVGTTPDLKNPFLYATNVGDGLQQLMIESLFYLNFETGEIEPWLAESYEYNADFTELTMTLRPGIEWSDGQPMTTADVVFTLNLLKANSPALWHSEGISRYVKDVTAVDDRVVKLTLAQANPRFIYTFAISVYNSVPIVPQHIWEGQDPTTFKNFDLAQGWPVFTGPYKLVQADQNQLIYDRRDDWWAAKTGFHELPVPKRVIMVTPGPEDRAAASLEAGDVDAIPQMGLGTFEAVKANNSSVIAWTDEAPYGWIDSCPDMLEINNMSKPWDDPEMRRALNLAIDKQGYANVTTEGAGIVARWLFPAYPKLDELMDQNQDLLEKYQIGVYDPEQALQIFESKGYTRNGDGDLVGPDGAPLTVKLLMITPETGGVQWGYATTALTQYLNDVGITVNPEVVDASVFEPAGRRGEFDVRLMWSCGSVVDPLDSMDNWHMRNVKPIGVESAGNEANPARWSNTDYSAIVDQMATLAPGDPKIAELTRQGLDIWYSQMPSIPLNQKPWIVPFNTTYWTNWPTAENNYFHPPIWWQTTLQIVLNLQPATQ
jgi:peptide/nickel transport system substrate-binding protein